MASTTKMRTRDRTIGELSRLTGVNIETIRYYERINILPQPPRTAAGRRSYDSGHISRLHFVRRARDLGFSIAEIRTLLGLSDQVHGSCAEARRIAVTHLNQVRAKLTDLEKLEQVLADTIARCDAECCARPAPVCPVVEILQN